MTNELQVFENNQFGQMRTITENGTTLFCGSDVAKALGYTNAPDALTRHCRGIVKRDTPTSSGVQTMSFIPEGDVYRLITHSKLPTAEKFERWVFDEVLPTVRQTGAYMTPETIEKVLMNPDTIISLATQLKELQTKVEQDKPKVQYFDTLVDRNLLTNFRDTAKELHVAPKAFINFLLEKGYIYRDNKSRLRPYQAHAEKGLFEVKEFASEFNNKAGIQTLITPKGRETFRLLVGNGLFGEGVSDAYPIE